MKENERNNYGIINTDGRITNIFDSKNTSLNDNKFFTKENNVSGVNEQEKVKEQTQSSSHIKPTRQPTTNLISISSFFATTATAAAGAVVVVAYVVAATIAAAVGLFAVTCDSVAFYVQGYLNYENPYIAKLYEGEQTREEFEITEPFIEFYELMPDTEYTLEIVDSQSEEVVFQKEFKTAPEDTYGVMFESWVEENTLMLYSYVNEDFPIPEEVTSYTIYVFDQKGNSIYQNSLEELPEEYMIELPEELFITLENPTNNDNPTPINDNVIKEQIIYVSILYSLNDCPIGRLQYVPLQGI